MPNATETIELLARKLESARIANDLKECKTLEDYEKLSEKYQALCNEDRRTE